MLPVPWPVVGSLLPIVGVGYLIRKLRDHRGKPGVNWFIVTLLAVMAWCLIYAGSLLVFDPRLRLVLEMGTWTAMMGTGITFLAFGLDYTGRGAMVRNPWFGMLVAVPVVTSGLVWTNPIHELVWTDFRLDPVLGVATVSYEFGALAYFAVLVGMVFVTAGMLVLFETVISYGPLFRSEALAVALSAVPPGMALLAWLTEIGPYPQLNLTPIMFLPHVAFDIYAFVGGGMFEFNPATRRTAQRRALEELDDPALVLDTRSRVVECNPAAESAFAVESPTALGEPITSLLGTSLDVDQTNTNQLIEYHGEGEYAEFSVSASALSGPSGGQVGYVLIFQNVTARRRRKQRLRVTNRVLRHNLRNDLNAASGYIELAREQVSDEDARAHLDRAKKDVVALLEMGEKARAFEQVLETLDTPTTTVSVESVLTELVERDEHAGQGDHSGDLTVTVPAGLELRLNERVFETLFANLIENGFEHAGTPDPRVTVSYDGIEGDHLAFRVRDRGSGIPDHELSVIERGEETPLSHGSGLGLWIVRWCTDALGGEIEFDSSAAGTTVTVRLPKQTLESQPTTDHETASSAQPRPR